MTSRNTEIGEIVNVTGNTISVQLLDTNKSNMPVIDGIVYRIGQIGSFLKIPLGYANLYGIVTQVGAGAIPEILKEAILTEGYDVLKNRQWLSMVLVGEQVGLKFDRGVSQSPTTGDKVHLVTIGDMEVIYGGFDESASIVVGNISAAETLQAKLDLNKLVARHCAILGSTGSGKSNSVVVILNSIASMGFKSSMIFVVYPHVEYNTALRNISSVYKINANTSRDEKELYVPFWALPFNELITIFSGSLSDQNRDFFRSKIVDAKINTSTNCSLDVEKEIITADSPIPFCLRNLWFDLDDFERQTFNERAKPETKTSLRVEGSAETLVSNEYEPAAAGGGRPFLNNLAKGMLGFLDSVRVKLKDSRYSFLFSPGPFSPDKTGKTELDLNDLLFEWFTGDNPVTILDLSGVPNEISSSISGALLKIVYDSMFWGQNLPIGGKEQPLLIVLEEAHSYLKAGVNSISSRTVQTIAKEGRKYGVGLVLVTQRPSELDETVLSQCGTIVALRMNNSKDRGHIKSAMQDELHTIVDLLPSLRTGEAIVSGEGVRIPSRIRLFKAANMPKSTDPLAAIKWRQENAATEIEYQKLIKLWRNQKLKEE